MEHVGIFTAQCTKISHCEALKLRLFLSTLTWAFFHGSKLPPIPLSKTQTTRLEELELAKAEIASLEAAAAEEMKMSLQWANGRVVVTALDEPTLELEAHLSGALEVNNYKAESCRPMKGLDDGQSKVEKSRKVQLKAKPLVLKSQVVTKVVLPPKVDEKKENAHEMVEDVRDKPQTREDKPKVEDVEEDQVMVDAQILEAKEKAEQYNRCIGQRSFRKPEKHLGQR
ncbi:unnamed protein product [Prunus armeniaca]